MTLLRLWLRAHWPHHKPKPSLGAVEVETIGYTTDMDSSEGGW